MDRIICDTYVKGEKHVWSSDKDDWSSQEFNKKILAVNDMYGWLYAKGILRDVAFEFKDYSDATFFALDTKDLEPYREAMSMSGLQDADVAVQHIFEEYYTPCEYSGAIELGWTMAGYRDVDGCVGRSWECGLLKGLDSRAAHDVLQVLEVKGVKEAVRAAFAFVGFEPSDISKNGARLSVAPLQVGDYAQVSDMDLLSGNCVAQYLEDNEEFAWGVFADGALAGYCTIGYADDCGPEIETYRGRTNDSLVISDVFVMPEYRELGIGSFLVNQAIQQRTKEDKQFIFLVVLDDRLAPFYEQIGFSEIGNGAMVRDERPYEVREFEDSFERAFAYYSRQDSLMEDNKEYLFENAQKLIDCYSSNEMLDMLDIDFWVQYESLLEESLTFGEYMAVDSSWGGDPHEIDENDREMLGVFKSALEEYRGGSILDILEDAVARSDDRPKTLGHDIGRELPF